MPRDLAQLRSEIDAVDRELLAALNRRATLANEVGELKRAEGSPVFRPEREAQVINGLQAANPGPLKDGNVATIWREIMSACRALEAPQRVAYLGPPAPSANRPRCSSSAPASSTCPASASTRCSRPPRPAPPTSAWCRWRTAPRAWSRARSTCCSARRCTSSANSACWCATTCCARTVRWPASKPCWRIRRRWPSARAGCPSTCPTPSGARSPATPKARAWPPPTRPGPASPANARPASSACTSRPTRSRTTPSTAPASPSSACRRCSRAPQASGKDCVSLVVSVPNKPGAVHDILVPLKQHGVSMTRFESRPAKSGQWEYFFFIDVQGHPSQPHVAAALADLRGLCAFYKVLGTYPVAD
jgi:chorismate mutase/prephenate dehydratase